MHILSYSKILNLPWGNLKVADDCTVMIAKVCKTGILRKQRMFYKQAEFVRLEDLEERKVEKVLSQALFKQ